MARLDQRHFRLIGRKDQTSCIVIACHRNYQARSWLATTLGNQTRLESETNAHRAVFQRLRGLPRALQHYPGRCSSQIIFSSVKSRDTKTGHENHWKDPSGRGCREPKSSLWFPGCSRHGQRSENEWSTLVTQNLLKVQQGFLGTSGFLHTRFFWVCLPATHTCLHICGDFRAACRALSAAWLHEAVQGAQFCGKAGKIRSAMQALQKACP